MKRAPSRATAADAVGSVAIMSVRIGPFHRALVFVLSLALALPAFAEIVPPKGDTDPRVRTMRYSASDVIRLDAFVGYQIHFQFAENEEFVNLGTGDRDGIDVGRVTNHLFIKPRAARVGTNITILTNRRVYHLHYRAHNRRPDPRHDEVIYSIRFTYPEDEARARAAAEQEAARKREARAQREALANAAASRPQNRDYQYRGTESLRPVEAFDDGVQTRLRFGARAEIPAIFLRNDDGTESLANQSIDRDVVVLHRVARQWVLRRGSLVGCIRNAAFDGGGERLETGTVHPMVDRPVVPAIPADGSMDEALAPYLGLEDPPMPASRVRPQPPL